MSATRPLRRRAVRPTPLLTGRKLIAATKPGAVKEMLHAVEDAQLEQRLRRKLLAFGPRAVWSRVTAGSAITTAARKLLN